MTPRLPASVLVLERGWLSANNILLTDGSRADLVDSGYCTHVPQTLALVEQALAGRSLQRIVNTHVHSDHIGGNSALQARHGCTIAIPAGHSEPVAAWDEDALLLGPLGQRSLRFRHDTAIAAGDEIEMGGLVWRALPAPGHDMDALAFHNPEKRLLISGDALWENGFGVVFPQLIGSADALSAARATLETFSGLAVDAVLPGHGAPFADLEAALDRAFCRLRAFEEDIERLAWHGLKVVVAFHMLDRRRLRRNEAAGTLAGIPFLADVGRRYLRLPEDSLAERLISELCSAGALVEQDGWLLARG